MSGSLDIRAGDVLLFHGHSFVSWAIRCFDGTDVRYPSLVTVATIAS